MLRLAVVGIDGSGKSTTTLRAIQQVSRSLLVAKPGRPNIIASNGRIRKYLRIYSPTLVTRDYWLHLHENPPVLHHISQKIEEALSIVRKRFGSGVLQIDTSHRDELEVAGIVSECALKLPPDFSKPLYLRV
ncbi:MAG: hypothetical protein HY788_01405 [Deltaproteobacteria bacterium]|nr:hypothetical protein [Deltaproteobacteria bacterium]